jgi:hypothetical protein
MNRITRWMAAAVVLAGGLSATGPLAAVAKGPDGGGFGCSFDASYDGGVYAGQLQGGPVLVAELVDNAGVTTGAGVASGDMWCAIQVNDPASHHGYPPYATQVIGPYTTGVVTIPPTGITFTAQPGATVFMCFGNWIRLPDGTYIHTNYDANPNLTGAQCAAVGTAGGDLSVDPVLFTMVDASGT